MKYLSIVLTAVMGLFFTQTVVAQSDSELSAIKTDTVSAWVSKKQIVEKLEKLIAISSSSSFYYRIHSDGFDFIVGKKSISYICPVCGTETKYGLEWDWLGNFGKEEYTRNDFGEFEPICLSSSKEANKEAYNVVAWGIKHCKEEIKKIKGIHIALDESEFCKCCLPSIKEPKLCLLVNIDGEPDTAKTRNISYYDIELLQKFLNGKILYFEYYDYYAELTYNKKRIKELLGIKDH